MDQYKEAGDLTTVSTMLNYFSDNPTAKLTAQEIVERLQRVENAAWCRPHEYSFEG